MPAVAPRAPLATILYRRDGYCTQGARLLGRHAAGEGFLRALVTYGQQSPLSCQARSRAEFDEFCQLVRPWVAGDRKVRWIDATSLDSMGRCGTLHRPDCMLVDEAFRREFVPGGAKAYSLTGVTHTIATRAVLRTLADLLLAPLEPWDALICTSQSVKTAVERLHSAWADYLEVRTGSWLTAPLRLPIIPLGIHTDSFPTGEARQAARQRIRSMIQAQDGDIVALFVGRLTYYAKAHPAPMYLALERIAQTTQVPIHLVQAGWFENDEEEQDFRRSAATLAPHVRCHFMDGRSADIRVEVWSGADIFISLSDNIQETFGLTPIEAMANGLPVVVSDWDGYRETVRHEIDGLLIPTVAPSGGTAHDWTAAYLVDDLSYSSYVARVSMSTAVDVHACTDALSRLVNSADLRRSLGENGRQRARATYDWRVVISAYEELWTELTRIRQHHNGVSPKPSAGRPPVPWLDDPYRQFAHYPTHTLGSETRVTLGQMAHPDAQPGLTQLACYKAGSVGRASEDLVKRILSAIEARGALSVSELASELDSAKAMPSEAVLARTLVHLAKFDVLRLAGQQRK